MSFTLAALANLAPSPDSLPTQLLGMVCGVMWVYAALFGTGNLLYGHMGQAALCGVVFLVASFGLWKTAAALFGARDTANAAG